MENKHTPGPWYNDGRGVITGGKYLATTIAETPKCRWVANERFEVAEEAEANARLLAAAPDLLAALETALQICPGDMLTTVWGDESRAAIAKAKGE